MTRQVGERGIPAPRSWSRAELALAALLLALAAVAWLLTGSLAMPGMGPRMAAEGMAAGEQRGGRMPAGLFLLTWVIMMAAMMLPAITPFTVGVSRLTRAGPGVLAGLTAGYLLVWSATGVLAYLVLRGFPAFTASGGVLGARLGAGASLLAGLYQFSPLKQWCLVRCRSPLALVVRYGEVLTRGRGGALAVGFRHGGYCLGCCWALMLVLLVTGVMNLVWMATVAAVIAVERVLPGARQLSAGLGVLLIGGSVRSCSPCPAWRCEAGQGTSTSQCTGPVYFSPGPWPGGSGTTDASRKARCRLCRPSRIGAA